MPAYAACGSISLGLTDGGHFRRGIYTGLFNRLHERRVPVAGGLLYLRLRLACLRAAGGLVVRTSPGSSDNGPLAVTAGRRAVIRAVGVDFHDGYLGVRRDSGCGLGGTAPVNEERKVAGPIDASVRLHRLRGVRVRHTWEQLCRCMSSLCESTYNKIRSNEFPWTRN